MGLLKETNAQYYAGQQYIGNVNNFIVKGWGDGTETPRQRGNKNYLLIKDWNFDTEPISAYGPYSPVDPITETSNYTIYYQAIGSVIIGGSDGDYENVMLGDWVALPESLSFVSSNLTNNERYIGLRTGLNDNDTRRFFNDYFKNVLVPIVNNLNISAEDKAVMIKLLNEDLDKNGITPGHLYIQLKQGAINTNYGDYSSICMDDIVNNFIVGYVGVGKLISSVKRTDVMFHAKRGLQEFSYDTLKSIRSQELTIPPSLSLALPQDYVNYVNCSWIDDAGAKHIIYPTRVTSNPNEMPIQDQDGSIEQNFFGENNYAEQSITETNWASQTDINNLSPDDYRYPRKEFLLGQRYGLQPEEAQVNGKFTINERLGTFSFSSDLVNKLIILEYISDGLSDCDNECIPKMAEQAMYMHIAHGILSSRMNVPEYIINRYKRERSSALRTAKIRLSNVKIEEISQVFRNKGKWIKH